MQMNKKEKLEFDYYGGLYDNKLRPIRSTKDSDVLAFPSTLAGQPIKNYNETKDVVILLNKITSLEDKLDELCSILNQYSILWASAGKEGTDLGPQDIDDIREKINNLSQKIAVIEERTKMIEKLQDKVDQIPSTIKEVLKEVTNTLASKEYVQTEINKATFKIIGAVAAIVGLATVIIKLL